MELHKIEVLLEKYFDAEASLAEEKTLKDYFLQPMVAAHLEQYRPLFAYFDEAREESSEAPFALAPRVRINRNRVWLSAAASVAVLIGVGTFAYMHSGNQSNDLGTYDSPEQAFRETQKALSMLSANVNTGVNGVAYLKEYEFSKKRIFNYQIN